MTPSDCIALAVSVLVLGAAVFYIVKEKKKGNRCIGCPDAPTCPHKGSGCHHSH